MCEIQDQLGFLDAEIETVNRKMSEIRTELKEFVDKSGRDDAKRRYSELVESLLSQKLMNAARRLQTMEECRLSVVLGEMVDEDCEDCECEVLGKATETAEEVMQMVADATKSVVNALKTADEAKQEIKQEDDKKSIAEETV